MRAALAFALALSVTSAAAAQSPEDRGALTVDEWDAGRVSHAGASIPTRVLFPTDGTAPYPLVGVIHGASRTGARHRVLAETLASRGFVVVLPDMPCGFTGCDHDANANQLVAMLAWAVSESEGSSPIAGLVDGSRRGLIGHSWGALASHLAAARDPSIDAVVLFDPNDDGTEGRDATPAITAPVAQLLAAVPGACNGQWDEGAITPMLPAPALELTVSGSAHCDPEEPGDFLCPIGCGSGDASTSSIYRRYAVAWVACLLQSDPAMGAWLGGGSMSGDETGGVIEGVVARGLDGLPCRGGVGPTDAGVAAPDGGSAGDDAGAASDGGASAMDGGLSGDDAGATSGPDAQVPSTDAGAGGGTDGGCGCRAARPGPSSLGLFAALLALGIRRRAR